MVIKLNFYNNSDYKIIECLLKILNTSKQYYNFRLLIPQNH